MKAKLLTMFFVVVFINACLSVGTSVKPGKYDAVGKIPGCTATLITDNLVLTAAHCVCPTDNPNGCATRTTFILNQVFPLDEGQCLGTGRSLSP